MVECTVHCVVGSFVATYGSHPWELERVDMLDVIDILTLYVELIDDIGESGQMLELLPGESEPFVVKVR